MKSISSFETITQHDQSKAASSGVLKRAKQRHANEKSTLVSHLCIFHFCSLEVHCTSVSVCFLHCDYIVFAHFDCLDYSLHPDECALYQKKFTLYKHEYYIPMYICSRYFSSERSEHSMEGDRILLALLLASLLAVAGSLSQAPALSWSGEQQLASGQNDCFPGLVYHRRYNACLCLNATLFGLAVLCRRFCVGRTRPSWSSRASASPVTGRTLAKLLEEFVPIFLP